jgi:hypothetical protein
LQQRGSFGRLMMLLLWMESRRSYKEYVKYT